MIHQILRFALAFGFIFTVSRAQAADEIPAALKAQAKVTQEQASKTALAKVPNGKITSAELEKENGKLIWSFDIATKGKHVTEVQVDAKSGAIISAQAETPEEQAKEAAAEKKEKK